MSQAIVQRACAKLRTAIGDETVVRSSFTGVLRGMLEVLEAIQPALEDAEILMLSYRPVAQWLQHVWNAAYKTIDTVDKLQDARPQTAAGIAMRITPPLAPLKEFLAMKMVQETIELVMRVQWHPHELSEYTAENTMFQEIIEERKTGPVFEEAMILGRGSDKERIIAALLSTEPNIMQEHITILPIFGLAGSGKTTLAQMVFNDTHSLQGYDFRVWVHVSPQFDFHTIGNSIISHLSGREQEEINHSSSDVEGMECIMKRLHELLNLKKVLLVLDDLWEEDPIQLQLLKSMLNFLGSKVHVIVTTGNQAIARKICTVEPYRLNPLSDDTCWEIIKRKSIHFQKEEKDENLEKIGREMASGCCGVPSAARAFAGLLDHYRDASKCEGTMLGSKMLLPISTLELSYMSMPPDLKLCFAYYCAIFQGGHNIVKDDLVHHWIALNLIDASEILSAKQIAEEHITRLHDMSFLQTAKSGHISAKDDKGGILFTMHILVHNLARSFTGSLSYCLAINHRGELDASDDEYQRVLRCVGCSKVEFNNNSFSRKKYLRVLELTESVMPKLPNSIYQLRHLGYLKISEFTGLVTLPESLGNLTNLFHVDLSGCSGLLKLPESFGKLIRLVHANLSRCSELLNLPESVGKLVNLVHINLSGCSGLAALPESFGDLVNLLHIDLSHCHRLSKILEVLQKIDKVVYLDLSFWSCFEGIGNGLGGLTNLEHLNLSNPCCHLAQHRSHLQELKDAVCKLTKLRYLNLSMCLNPIFYLHQSRQDSLQYIADCIKGLSCLEHLDLSHNTFLFDLPESLGDLNRLHTLDLSGCIRIKKVGETKSLKVIIELSKYRGLESCQLMVRVDEGAYGSTSNLAQLEVVDCKELEISCLERLQSLEEAQRIRLADKQKVERLKLCWTVGEARGSMKVDENALLGELVPPHSLKCLEICGYGGETCLPAWRIPSISSHLCNLIEVTMENFPRCMVLPPVGLFPNLQRLVLRRMARITRIDAGELSGGNKEAFTRLSKLTIDDMENLKEFKFVVVDELAIQKCPLLSFGSLLPRAQRLLISECDQVMSSLIGGIDGVERPSAPVTELVVKSCNVPLGDWTLLRHLHGLCSLTINNCYNLTSSPEITRALSSLQQLAIDECHGIQSLPEDMLAKLTGLKALYIWDCPELKEWCESEENKQKLAHILIKFEKFDTSKTGVHPPEI